MSALHIAHALKQTEVQKAYNKAREKPIDHYLVSESTAQGLYVICGIYPCPAIAIRAQSDICCCMKMKERSAIGGGGGGEGGGRGGGLEVECESRTVS